MEETSYENPPGLNPGVGIYSFWNELRTSYPMSQPGYATWIRLGWTFRSCPLLPLICHQYPSRFIGIGTVPLQHVDEALKELERLSKELNLRGVIISSNVNGKDLDDAAFFPFFERAERLNLLIFVHPHNTAAAERMQRFYLTNLIGNPLDTTIAATRLIFSGLLEKLPDLKICFAHGGGHLPYIMGRIHHGYLVRPECKAEIGRSPWEYFGRLYFDTITHHLPALEYLVGTAGSDHVLMGTDYPYDMGDEDPVGFVRRKSWAETSENFLGSRINDVTGVYWFFHRDFL
jgi:aminocarboxymuconate-semialdehyde decarboxylase